MSDLNEKDDLSGVETTGHEWDGLKELNNPAPRWWLWVFFATVVWAFGYWVLYPAWPTLSGHTKGVRGWTEYTQLKEQQAEITAQRGALASRIRESSLADIEQDPQLYLFAQSAGKTMFRENCAACHGTGAQGGNGYPNLNDDDWIWGGDVDAIYATLRHGIRSGHEGARDSQMPAFVELLKDEEINAIAGFVRSLSGKERPSAEGQALYQQNCASCHGEAGRGGREFGAPNLSDAIWLYGRDKVAIVSQIRRPRHGVMPAWEGRLSEDTLKALAIYVHSLGGGEPTPAQK